MEDRRPPAVPPIEPVAIGAPHVEVRAGSFPAPSWSPPPREPFVPLRPLSLGQLLAGAFRVLRHNAAVTLGPAIVVSLLATVFGLLVTSLVIGPFMDAAGGTVLSDLALYSWMQEIGVGMLGMALASAASIAAGVIQQGISAVDATHAVLGRRLTLLGLRRRTFRDGYRLAGWGALVLVALSLGAVAGVATIAVSVEAVGDASLGVAAALMLLVLVLLTWLGTRLAFVPSVLIVERARLGSALRRSWRLTRRGFWRVFGIRILCWAMIAIATWIAAMPANLIMSLLQGIIAGNGDYSDSLLIRDIGEVAGILVTTVIAAVGLVVTTATDALLYIDLRMRREGLDLTLARFLESRRPGTRRDPSEPDPYAPPAGDAADAGASVRAPQPAPSGGAESPWT